MDNKILELLLENIEFTIIWVIVVMILLYNILNPSNNKKGFSLNFSNNRKNFNLKFLENYSINISKSYQSFHIPKKDWSQRLIEAPNEELKIIQKNILKDLQKVFILPSYVTAFKKWSGIKNNAKKHINKKIVINIDIENFFHSITTDKIQKALNSYKDISSEEINKLISLVTYNWRLAQWAPTSPFMANLVFLWVDKIILNLLKKYDKNISYSRYADDITFSSDKNEIKNAIRIITDSLLPKFWYKAKKKKTTIYRYHTKQLVTWLVVNKKVSYPKNKYMKLRSMVYNFLKKSVWNINIVKWHLAFLKSVDSKKYNKLKFYYKKTFKWTNNYELLFKKWKKRYKKLIFLNPRTWEMENIKSRF